LSYIASKRRKDKEKNETQGEGNKYNNSQTFKFEMTNEYFKLIDQLEYTEDIHQYKLCRSKKIQTSKVVISKAI